MNACKTSSPKQRTLVIRFFKLGTLLFMAAALGLKLHEIAGVAAIWIVVLPVLEAGERRSRESSSFAHHIKVWIASYCVLVAAFFIVTRTFHGLYFKAVVEAFACVVCFFLSQGTTERGADRGFQLSSASPDSASRPWDEA